MGSGGVQDADGMHFDIEICFNRCCQTVFIPARVGLGPQHGDGPRRQDVDEQRQTQERREQDETSTCPHGLAVPRQDTSARADEPGYDARERASS